MINITPYVKELSESLCNDSNIEDLEYYPMDRFYLEKYDYLERILSVNYLEFLLYNLERKNSTYTIQLFVCLPELWEKVTYNDILNLIKNFTNSFSFYALIQYTYKYLNVNLLDEIFSNENIDVKFKKDCANYFSNIIATLYINEHDYRMLTESFFGISLNQIERLQRRFQQDTNFIATISQKELKKKLLEIKEKL